MGDAETVIVSDGGRMAWLHRTEDSVTTLHCLPAVRVIVPLEALVRVQAPEGIVQSRDCIVVGANQPVVAGCEGAVVTAFVDLRSPLASAQRAAYRVLEPALSARLQRIVRVGLAGFERSAAPMLQEFVAELGVAESRRSRDKRSEQAFEWLEANKFEPWSMSRLARHVGVSGSHLAHLLKHDFGVSARTLALYHRTRGGALELSSGASVAHVAQRAGFSDQAHFSRALRRFFGKTSSYVRRSVRDRRAGRGVAL